MVAGDAVDTALAAEEFSAFFEILGVRQDRFRSGDGIKLAQPPGESFRMSRVSGHAGFQVRADKLVRLSREHAFQPVVLKLVANAGQRRRNAAGVTEAFIADEEGIAFWSWSADAIATMAGITIHSRESQMPFLVILILGFLDSEIGDEGSSLLFRELVVGVIFGRLN